MADNSIMNELFKTIDIITDHKLYLTQYVYTEDCTVISATEDPFTYKISYQNQEFDAHSPIGEIYEVGQSVVVLFTDYSRITKKIILFANPKTSLIKKYSESIFQPGIQTSAKYVSGSTTNIGWTGITFTSDNPDTLTPVAFKIETDASALDPILQIYAERDNYINTSIYGISTGPEMIINGVTTSGVTTFGTTDYNLMCILTDSKDPNISNNFFSTGSSLSISGAYPDSFNINLIMLGFTTTNVLNFPFWPTDSVTVFCGYDIGSTINSIYESGGTLSSGYIDNYRYVQISQGTTLYVDRIHPNPSYIGDGLVLSLTDSNPYSVTFSNLGTINLADNIYIDTINDRIGLNNTNPLVEVHANGVIRVQSKTWLDNPVSYTSIRHNASDLSNDFGLVTEHYTTGAGGTVARDAGIFIGGGIQRVVNGVTYSAADGIIAFATRPAGSVVAASTNFRMAGTDFQINGLAGTGNRAVYSTSTGILTNTSSDRTMKTNIMPLTYGLDIINRLNPVFYNWIDTDRLGSQTEIGFIAQEVKELIPEVVGENSDGTLSMDYQKMVPALTKAIQEQSVIIQNLMNEIEALKSKLG